jgi:homoserine O-acetyltransferase
LGSSFGSTNPHSIEPSTGEEYRLRFPVLAISDVVKAQMKLFARLGIEHAHAVVGGSLGGMQAICFAIEYPEFARNVIIMASTYATQPWAIAFNKIAVEGIRRDPAFKGGYYDRADVEKDGLVGMALGRMAGHISFLSPYSMERKFSRNYVQTDGLYELFGRYEVERYLEYNGYNFPRRFDPLSYLYIVKMMNNFDVTRHYETLTGAFALTNPAANIHLVAFSGDVLFPPTLMREIYDALVKLGREKTAHYICIDSDYGHDAFLVEIPKIEAYVRDALNSNLN